VINALWLSVEVSLNDEELLVNADIGFQVAEHSFCAFFFIEWLIRFSAFKQKLHSLKDSWFLFDTVIVLTMVLETWILSIIALAIGSTMSAGSGSSSILRIVKVFRLTRVLRIGRLFRAFPEIILIVRSLAVVMRTVLLISLLLLTTTYVFAIVMTQLCKGSKFQNNYFESVPTAMFSLILCAVFPDMKDFTNDLASESWFYAFLFLSFTVFATLIILNMLIGALVEVVHGVASVEREANEVRAIKDALESLLSKADMDNSNGICRYEFDEVMSDPLAYQTLSRAGVDVEGLMEMVDVVFYGREEMTTREVMEWFLQLRSGNSTKVKDLTDLRRYLHADITYLQKSLAERLGGGFTSTASHSQQCHKIAKMISHKDEAAPSVWDE
jgi:hypothetical protein